MKIGAIILSIWLITFGIITILLRDVGVIYIINTLLLTAIIGGLSGRLDSKLKRRKF